MLIVILALTKWQFYYDTAFKKAHNECQEQTNAAIGI